MRAASQLENHGWPPPDISRLMRSRITGSTGVEGAAAGFRLHRRRTLTTSTIRAPRPTKDTVQTRRLNPSLGGASRIHSPYLWTKYWRTCSGVSPAARRSRMIWRIWFAVSEGESATERVWHTTQRSWAASSWTTRSSTGTAAGAAALSAAETASTVRAEMIFEPKRCPHVDAAGVAVR